MTYRDLYSIIPFPVIINVITVRNGIPTVENLENIIEEAFENRKGLSPDNASQDLRLAIDAVLTGLNDGTYRIAEKKDGKWEVRQWLKKAVLLSFAVNRNQVLDGGHTRYYDKVKSRFADLDEDTFARLGVRVVPPAMVRNGAYVAANVVLMPSYVNIGAYVDSGSMIDTWATVGSCAQIGRNVHLSGGAGIGGVLEPLQANPTIIEDNCFIGARSEIVEGVIVGEGSVISMGVYIGQSTKIYNRETGEISFGFIPPGSVVVSGNLPSRDGNYSLYCAVIVKQVDAKTRGKVSLNELLREI